MPKGVSVTLEELIQRAQESRISDIWTALPGVIQTYYPGDSPTADIIPQLKRPVPTEDDGITHEDLPVIPNVPIMFPRGKKGAYSITWPLEAGDSVLLVFSTLPIGQWRTNGQLSEPGDLRLHHLGSAVAYPGMGPDAEALGGGAPDPSSMPALVVEGPEIRLGKEATDQVALASALFDFMKATLQAGVPAAQDGGANLKTTMIKYMTDHASPIPFAALKVKAK